MPVINNEEVRLNDVIFDLANGRGRIVSITANSIEVLFDNGRRISFNEHGELNGFRRLFWQWPVIVDTPKDINAWKKFADVIVAVHNLTN